MTLSPWRRSDVILTYALQGKGSAYYGNSYSTRQRISYGPGLEIFIYINRILTKLCHQKLGGPVIMEHRVHDLTKCLTAPSDVNHRLLNLCAHSLNNVWKFGRPNSLNMSVTLSSLDINALLEYAVRYLIDDSSTALIPEITINYKVMIQNKRKSGFSSQFLAQ